MSHKALYRHGLCTCFAGELTATVTAPDHSEVPIKVARHDTVYDVSFLPTVTGLSAAVLHMLVASSAESVRHRSGVRPSVSLSVLSFT